MSLYGYIDGNSRDGQRQQDILIIGALFPAIPPVMIIFGNRYTVLANLIRYLHAEVLLNKVSLYDAERFFSRSGVFVTGCA